MLSAHAWWGFDSCMGVEYSVVITLTSRGFRKLLTIPQPWLRFFAQFWLRRGRIVWRPLLYCLPSQFLLVRSLYWVLGLCGVRLGYGCLGNDRCDDSSADSSASLAQCCYCGGFFPSFAIFALLWGLLLFLDLLALIPRLHFLAPPVSSPLISHLRWLALCVLAAGLHLC